jgi:hypothetical protein
MPNKPRLASTAPRRSSLEAVPRDSASLHQAKATRTTPIGTFSQKMYCHAQPVVMAPPTRGPMATAAPPRAPQMPSAAFRRSGVTAALRSVNDRGMTMAPPAPWTARAATSTPMDGASAATADAAVKMAMPIMKTRRRPNLSPMAAALRRRTAKVKVYALTVHSRPLSPACMCTRMTGNAVVTTRLSSDAMKRARPVMTTAQAAPPRPLCVADSACSSALANVVIMMGPFRSG